MKVNEENLQLINDNSARDINNNLPKKSFVAFTQNQFDIGNGNIINLDIWETSGGRSYLPLTLSYSKSADILLYVHI